MNEPAMYVRGGAVESGTVGWKLPASIARVLRCPRCRGSLDRQPGGLECVDPACGLVFPSVGGVPVLINDESSVFTRAEFVAQRKTTFDHHRNPFVRRVDAWLPKLGRNIKASGNYDALAAMLLKRSSQPLVLVVGGSVMGNGMDRLACDPRFQVVETDVSAGPRTQLICDAHDLPFAAECFDAVIAQAVLQYVADPQRCVQEITRILKPGGFVYVESAFMQQVVHGCYDFTRFTHLGLRRLFRDYAEVNSGPVCGPGMALAWAGQFFLLSMATSRPMRRLMHVVGRLTLFWLKYWDAWLIDQPGTYDAASGFFFLGTKSGQGLSDRELVTLYRGAQ